MKTQDKAIHDRLRRAEGQLRGVCRMIDEERSCETILTQIMAVRAALDRAAQELVMSHVDECVAKLPPEEARDTVGRAIRLLGRIA